MKLKSTSTFFTLVIVFVCFLTLFSGKVNSQSQQPFDTFTISLTGNDLNTISGLIISIAFSGGTALLDNKITFNGTGASLLLTDVDVSKNEIVLVLNGKITDGKVSITNKIKPNSISGNPTIIVTKVKASGGTDITNSLTISVKTFSSVIPTPTSTPTLTPPPTSTPTPTSSPTPKTKKPTLTLTGPEELLLRSKGLNAVKIKATASKFTSKTKCQAESSDKLLVKVRPSRFLLSPVRNNRTLTVRVHPISARDLIESDSSKTIKINASCSNETKAELDLLLKTF